MKTYKEYLLESEFITESDSQNLLNFLNEEINFEEEEIISSILEKFNNGEISINDLEDVSNESVLGSILGGLTGFALGTTIGKIVANALGIEKGVIYDLLTSKLVGAALGAAIGKRTI